MKNCCKWFGEFVIWGFLLHAAVGWADTSPSRIQSGLQALYDFQNINGDTIEDRSGIGEPLHLTIDDPEAVQQSEGALKIINGTIIKSNQPAEKLLESIPWTGELTIEAWVKPASLDQEGPARIATLSANSGQRNFTLGQDNDRYDFRLRTTGTSTNGVPSVHSGENSLTTEKTHIVYTRNRNGRTRIYLNGELATEENVLGEFSTWSNTFEFALANELDGSRPWLGTYYLLAIYNRSLLPDEVEQNYQAGTDVQSLIANSNLNANAQLFEKKVAPILVQRCFECHDSATREGGLNLSQKSKAFSGGHGGDAIVPGNAEHSPLYTLLEFDVMPQNREPLSDEEKFLIKEWIDAGADWTIDNLDPTLFSHNQSEQQIWVQRLTVDEYINTVKATVGVDIEEQAREILPPDIRADGFSNTAYNLSVDLKHIQSYSELAEIIVNQMDVLAFTKQYSNSTRLTDDNMRKLIADMGKWVLRGPLNTHEIDVYRGISTTVASAGGDFKEAVQYILEAMLQSPRFLYRLENHRGDGTLWPVDQYELASRLSYIIWGAPPDHELMKAADQGDLYDKQDIVQQVQRMLKDPRAIERSSQFLAEWVNLGNLVNLQPNHEKFPNWDPAFARDMQAESLAFFQYVAWELNKPLIDLFSAQVTFLTNRLAKHYGIDPNPQHEDESDTKLVKYDLTDTPGRGGLLTQGSILTKGGDEASMVTRGLFVLHHILRGSVQDPPPCVDTTPVPTEPGLTQRNIAEDRIANPACGGCHQKFEPLAFGLEKFDGLGSYHEEDEYGNQLRDDGNILIPGQENPIEYENSDQLMEILVNSDRVKETITWKLTQFALGRPLGSQDAPLLDDISQQALQQGGTYKDFITAIATSDLVRKTKTEAYINE